MQSAMVEYLYRLLWWGHMTRPWLGRLRAAVVGKLPPQGLVLVHCTEPGLPC